MSAVADDPRLAQPGDEEAVTRGEYRRLTNVVLTRLERIENLCFNDEPTRPSLETLLAKADRHIDVICTWGRWLKWTVVGVGSFAAAFMASYNAGKVFGLW